MVLEDIPGHKEHYHLLVKDGLSYNIGTGLNSRNLRME